MPNLYFFGVTTAQSSMVRILPAWSESLNLNLNLVGIDLPVGADPSAYRKAVSDLKGDPAALGSLITTHKLSVYEHAADLFDAFDDMSDLTKEVSTITKRGNYLTGQAISECLASTFALKHMFGENYWDKHRSDVLCFGAGGAGRTIALTLLFDFEAGLGLKKKRSCKPKRLLLVDIDEDRLRSAKYLLEPLRDNLDIQYICNTDPRQNDDLLNKVKEHSLIINATGMGKDRPGSPISDQAQFPIGSVVWELNYRGERLFLQQAKAQEATQQLDVHDGWICFMHGWTQTLQLVLGQQFTAEQFKHLTEIAEPFRI